MTRSNDEAPIDLTALEPDAARWEALIHAALVRTDDALEARSDTPLVLIAAWRRPLLVAAALFVALLVPVEVVLELREPRTEQVERLVTLSEQLGRAESSANARQFLRALTPEAM